MRVSGSAALLLGWAARGGRARPGALWAGAAPGALSGLASVGANCLFAMAAAGQAIEDSGWVPEDEEARERTGVMIGSVAVGGIE